MAPTSLPAALHGLLLPQAYPHPVGELRVIETHMSWVLLTGEYAYKIKRPVRFPFADFRDPAHRAHLCAEEVRLNRRFAPALYLGVATVRASGGIATFTGSGPVIETAVQMRQFDRSEELDILVTTGRIDAAELAYFGEMLAGIHETLPAPPADTDYGTPTAVARLLHRNLAELQTIANHGPSEAAVLRHRLAQQLRRSRRALATEPAADISANATATSISRTSYASTAESRLSMRWSSNRRSAISTLPTKLPSSAPISKAMAGPIWR